MAAADIAKLMADYGQAWAPPRPRRSSGPLTLMRYRPSQSQPGPPPPQAANVRALSRHVTPGEGFSFPKNKPTRDGSMRLSHCPWSIVLRDGPCGVGRKLR